MMELILNLPDQVIGIVASGQVSAKAYETVLIPAIESTLAAHGRVRMLYQLGTAFTGFSLGAMWDDLKLGVAHLKAWEKIAVVTDVDWIAGSIRLFGFAMPYPAKAFSNHEIAEARQWIAAA